MRKQTSRPLRAAGLCAATLFFLACALLTPQHAAHAAKAEKGTPLPAGVLASIDYLLKQESTPNGSVDRQSLSPLLDFVEQENSDMSAFDLPERQGAYGASLAFDIHVPLAKILDYCYNPAVPAYALYPSSVRLGGWYPDSDIVKSAPLKNVLAAANEPQVLRGREYEEITPDSFSGAYYRYDLNRLLVLMKHKGKNVFITVSRQDGPSSVGKKGAIVGQDEDWNYFYSGIDGLTTGGIGWMDTYMYDSFSVTVFIEEPAPSATTRVAVFKWLKAGWAKLNVVKPSHILSGLRRFTLSYRSVLESGSLPSAATLEQKLAELESMDDKALEAAVAPYARALELAQDSSPMLQKSQFTDIIENGGYAGHLSRSERICLLVKEFLKESIGKPCLAAPPAAGS